MTTLETSHYSPTHSTLIIEVVTCRKCHASHRIPAPQLMLRLRHRYARHITLFRPRALIAEYLDIPPGLIQEVIEVHSTSTHCQLCYLADSTQLCLFPEPPTPRFIPQPFPPAPPRPVAASRKREIIPATLDEL